MVFARPAFGQSAAEAIASAKLGSAYAQMLNLSTTADISSAHYNFRGSGPQPSIDILRLPYESKWTALSSDTDLYWRIGAGYLRYREGSPTDTTEGGPGHIAATWSAYSFTGGLLARMRLGSGFTFEPALDIGVERLKNRADYSGTAQSLRPLLDGTLFNWQTNAWSVTPNMGLGWAGTSGDKRMSVSGHVSWSWISSFNESNPILKFGESAAAYSIRAELAQPTTLRPFGRPLDWVLHGGYSGLFGKNRNALDITSMAEIGVGLEAPLNRSGQDARRLHLGLTYFHAREIRGWSVGLGLRY